ISRYTREAGVRDLERTLGRIARKVARRFAEAPAGGTGVPPVGGTGVPPVGSSGGTGVPPVVTVGPDDLLRLLGPERVRPEPFRKELPPGVSTGLAWTEAGGDVLYVEATLLRDGRGLRLTGQLGDVMKESARAAQSFVWSHAESLGIDPDLFRHSG